MKVLIHLVVNALILAAVYFISVNFSGFLLIGMFALFLLLFTIDSVESSNIIAKRKMLNILNNSLMEQIRSLHNENAKLYAKIAIAEMKRSTAISKGTRRAAKKVSVK